MFQHEKATTCNKRKNYRTCNRLDDAWKTVQFREGGGGGRRDGAREGGEVEDSLADGAPPLFETSVTLDAVQSTIRWRAHVRSSETIKIRQLLMILSVARGRYKSFFSFFFLFISFGSLIFSPLKSPAIK